MASAERTNVQHAARWQCSHGGNVYPSGIDHSDQVRLDATCRQTRRVKLFAGHTFLYWNAPLRAGDQIDLSVNPSLPTGPARPAIPFRTDNFWAQGGDVGLQFSW